MTFSHIYCKSLGLVRKLPEAETSQTLLRKVQGICWVEVAVESLFDNNV
jgi:hypothetical protein